MKRLSAIIMAALLIAALSVTAFAADSLAVKFNDAAGVSASGGTEPLYQMTDYAEFAEGTAVAVTFTSEDVPYLNLRSKASPFNDSDNVWLFMEPSYIEGDIAYFTYDEVKQLYLEGACQNSGVKTTDLQPDFEAFLNISCDWIGIYTYDNTVTITKVEIVKAEAAPEEPVAAEPEAEAPAADESEAEAPAANESEAANAPAADPAVPETGLAVAVIPAVLALVSAAASKKK